MTLLDLLEYAEDLYAPDVIEQVKALIGRGEDVNARDEDGRTALHAAASNGADLEIFKALLDAGANVNAQDKYGRTALHELISGHANFKRRSDQGAAHDRRVYEESFTSAMRALIEKDADVNMADRDGRTPLEFIRDARDNMPPQAFALLLDAGADLSAIDRSQSIPSTIGERLLSSALREEPRTYDREYADILVTRGVDLNNIERQRAVRIKEVLEGRTRWLASFVSPRVLNPNFVLAVGSYTLSKHDVRNKISLEGITRLKSLVQNLSESDILPEGGSLEFVLNASIYISSETLHRQVPLSDSWLDRIVDIAGPVVDREVEKHVRAPSEKTSQAMEQIEACMGDLSAVLKRRASTNQDAERVEKVDKILTKVEQAKETVAKSSLKEAAAPALTGGAAPRGFMAAAGGGGGPSQVELLRQRELNSKAKGPQSGGPGGGSR